jgi:hypothetical protein
VDTVTVSLSRTTLSAAGVHPIVRTLDPARLGDHLDRLYRAAWALCGSREDPEDLESRVADCREYRPARGVLECEQFHPQ